MIGLYCCCCCCICWYFTCHFSDLLSTSVDWRLSSHFFGQQAREGGLSPSPDWSAMWTADQNRAEVIDLDLVLLLVSVNLKDIGPLYCWYVWCAVGVNSTQTLYCFYVFAWQCIASPAAGVLAADNRRLPTAALRTHSAIPSKEKPLGYRSPTGNRGVNDTTAQPLHHMNPRRNQLRLQQCHAEAYPEAVGPSALPTYLHPSCCPALRVLPPPTQGARWRQTTRGASPWWRRTGSRPKDSQGALVSLAPRSHGKGDAVRPWSVIVQGNDL